MSKGRIIHADDEGRYRVALVRNMALVDKAIERLNQDIAKCDDELLHAESDYWKKYLATQDEGERKKIQTEYDMQVEGIKIVKVSCEQQVKELKKIEREKIVDLYCADYSLDLSGEVGVIEFFGDPRNGQVIYPGYGGAAAFNKKRDGAYQVVNALHDASWLWDLLVGTAWQRWRYAYRAAHIVSVQDDRAEIEMEQVGDHWSWGLGQDSGLILGGGRYSDVPIWYMDCNGQAFDAGDRVIVQMEKDKPKGVIGFADKPKECPLKIVVFASFYSDGSNGLEAGRNYIGKFVHGKLTAAYDINQVLESPKQSQLQVYDAQPETNSVLVQGWKYYPDRPSVPTTVRIPIEWYDWEYAFITGAFEYAGPWTYGGNFGGYRLHAWFDATSLLGQVMRQEPSYVDFRVYPRAWVDENHDNQYEESELYPPDHKYHYYEIRGIATYYDRIVVGYWEGYNSDPDLVSMPESQVRSGIMEFESPHYDVDQAWYWGADPSFFDYHFTRELMTFENQDAFKKIVAMAGCEGILYVATKDDGGCTLTAYDTDDGMSVTGSMTFDGYEEIGRIVVNRWRPEITGDEYRITVGLNAGPVYVLNWMTLEVLGVISVSSSISTGSAVGARPYPPYLATRIINEYRKKNGVNQQITYSGALRDIEQKHLDWLVANGRYQHEDASGREPWERIRPDGFWSVKENIALFEIGTQEEIINEAMRLWDESPRHKAALLDDLGMAFSFQYQLMPAKWDKVIAGPGMYDPTTHQYSTEDTTIEIPEYQRGKLIIAAFTIARF
jgi:hypothetical protein